jgi:hypothetical protein
MAKAWRKKIFIGLLIVAIAIYGGVMAMESERRK